MSLASDRQVRAERGSLAASPLLVLAVAMLAVVLLLIPKLSVPVGPLYWDVFIYYDAANRIFSGQVPILDFFTPVGPLGYYLFAGWLWLFPNGQPSLMAHWSLLAITAPLMALIVADIDARARVTAYAVLVPFLIFALLPFNLREFYPFPGSDGFGIYNRQCCQMLYVLVAALMFVRDQRRLAIIVFCALTALFFLKITGFVAALIICFYAFLSGRILFKPALAAALAFLALLGALELGFHLVSHYIEDILALVDKNSGTIAPRFLQAASQTFGVVALTLALAALWLYADRRAVQDNLAAARANLRPATLGGVLDHESLWLCAVLFAGILFETQNTGSQAMIFLWPVVLTVLLKSGRLQAEPKLLIATLAVAAAAMLPLAVNIAERAGRTYIGAIKNVPLASANLRSLGSLNMRPEVQTRVEHMLNFYPLHQELYQDLVEAGELPTPILYSDYDFQITQLIAMDHGVASIRAREAAKGIRFETIMSMNFVNPFPWLLDRTAPKHIAIGADPSRAVPRPGPAVVEAVEATDLVLYPKCPLTTANAELFAIYQPMLARHIKVPLDDCYDAFVNPRFADRLN